MRKTEGFIQANLTESRGSSKYFVFHSCSYIHLSFAGFLRRMLGLGDETRVGAPPTPPWVFACTMLATGCVVVNVVLMGLATKPSAKTTPEKRRIFVLQTPHSKETNGLHVIFLCRFNCYQALLQTAAAAVAVAAE